MNAVEILASGHRVLFPGNEASIKSEFRRLSKIWHPDHNHDPKAEDVFAHLSEMRKLATERTQGQFKIFKRENGKEFRMEYLRMGTGNACEIYLGATSVAYLVGGANSHLSDRASARKWKFADSKMKEEMERFLPRLRREERLEGNGRLFIYHRNPDQILMSDMLAIEGGKIDPVHVSWMVTRMMNIACYLEYSQIANLALSPEFLLVSPEAHGVSLTGPTLYTTAFGNRPKFAPAKTVSLAPEMRRPDYEATSIIDRQLIRDIGLQLLGDPSGNRIRTDPKVRPDVAKWLNSAPPPSAVADYEAWIGCLGKRKFVVYPKSAQQLYAAN